MMEVDGGMDGEVDGEVDAEETGCPMECLMICPTDHRIGLVNDFKMGWILVSTHRCCKMEVPH